MTRQRSVEDTRWGVYLLREKEVEHVGSVIASDHKEAVERAFIQCDIAKHDRWRISVHREA